MLLGGLGQFGDGDLGEVFYVLVVDDWLRAVKKLSCTRCGYRNRPWRVIVVSREEIHGHAGQFGDVLLTCYWLVS